MIMLLSVSIKCGRRHFTSRKPSLPAAVYLRSAFGGLSLPLSLSQYAGPPQVSSWNHGMASAALPSVLSFHCGPCSTRTVLFSSFSLSFFLCKSSSSLNFHERREIPRFSPLASAISSTSSRGGAGQDAGEDSLRAGSSRPDPTLRSPPVVRLAQAQSLLLAFQTRKQTR